MQQHHGDAAEFFGGTDQAEDEAKEDEADGVSLLSFAFHPPSPRHQTKEALLIKSRSMTSLHNGIDQGFLR